MLRIKKIASMPTLLVPVTFLVFLGLMMSLSLLTAVPSSAEPLVLSTKNADSTAVWSTVEVNNGCYSVYLDSGTVAAGDGDTAQIRIAMAPGTTLDDIASISWWEYNVAGYPPHVDIMVDTDCDTSIDDALVIEYAYNGHIAEAPMPYGALTGAWYQTFSDDGNGPSVIDDTAYAWLDSGPPGGPGIIGGTLGDWKAGTVDPSVDGDTCVVALDVEVDNWVVNSTAYVDDIAINGANIPGSILYAECTTMYWKDHNGLDPDGYMPDIDQNQDFDNMDMDNNPLTNVDLNYCAPVAEANSLWWLDKEHNLGIFADPLAGTGYIGGDWNADGAADILDLVYDLAWFKDTNGIRTGIPHTGTLLVDEQEGIAWFLEEYDLYDELYEHTVRAAEFATGEALFTFLEDEVKRSQDVKLDLSFWHVGGPMSIPVALPPPLLIGPNLYAVWWERCGAHAVTVAGVDSENFLFAISDPDNDAAEGGAFGIVRPDPGGHPHPDATAHNIEMNASHDIYFVGPSPSPASKLGLVDYPFPLGYPADCNLDLMEWQVVGPVIVEWPELMEESMMFAEIHAATIVSPIVGFLCGNGDIDAGEECDDGNNISGDGCDANCQLEYCGDGILQTGLGEVCDDGNVINGDGCDATCQPESLPDFVIFAFTAPSTAGVGQIVNVKDTTMNNGPGWAGASITRFYLSPDTTPQESEKIGERGVFALSAGSHSTATTAVTIPSVPAGAYYLIAKTDAPNTIAEMDETNNTNTSRIVLVGPDLIVSSLFAPASASSGGTIDIKDTTKNDGAGAAGSSTTSFYLSTDTILDPSDTALGSRAVGVLGAGVSSMATTSVAIPGGIAGKYYIIAKADNGGAVAETDENNNTRSTRGAVLVGPDLYVSAFTVPASANAGDTISIGDTTKNKGPADAAASTTRFYLSTNFTLDASDVELGTGRTVLALVANASSAGTTNVTIDAGTSAGVYYIIAKADADEVVGEHNENNNTRFKRIVVTGGPDLVVSALNVPITANAGTQISVVDTTENVGGASAGASTTKFYLSADTVFDSLDTLLNYNTGRAVPALAAGASSTGTTTVTIPIGTLTGSYYIIARADANGVVAETDETNNTTASTAITVP